MLYSEASTPLNPHSSTKDHGHGLLVSATAQEPGCAYHQRSHQYSGGVLESRIWKHVDNKPCLNILLIIYEHMY